MGFAAWFLNIDGASPQTPPPPVPPTGPTPVVLGTIMSSFFSNKLIREDNERIRRLNKNKLSGFVKRIQGPQQFSFSLFKQQRSFVRQNNPKLITLKFTDVKNKNKEFLNVNYIQPNFRVKNNLIGLDREERDMIKKDFYLDEFLRFKPKEKVNKVFMDRSQKEKQEFDFERFLKYVPSRRKLHYKLVS